MPNTPIAVRIPPRCDNCGRLGLVHIVTTIKGEHVLLQWHCRACEAEWPVKRREEVTPPTA